MPHVPPHEKPTALDRLSVAPREMWTSVKPLVLPDIEWASAFQPRRSDPDLRPVPLGFLALIVVGGLLLLLPVAHAPGRSLALIDAFFLSVSAVGVTGRVPSISPKSSARSATWSSSRRFNWAESGS